MYKLYYQKNVRRAYVGETPSKEAALKYLEDADYAVVEYLGNYYFTKEELEDVKSKRSKSEFRVDFDTSGGGEVSESSDRELHSVAEESGGGTDSSESSSERDS